MILSGDNIIEVVIIVSLLAVPIVLLVMGTIKHFAKSEQGALGREPSAKNKNLFDSYKWFLLVSFVFFIVWAIMGNPFLGSY